MGSIRFNRDTENDDADDDDAEAASSPCDDIHSPHVLLCPHVSTVRVVLDQSSHTIQLWLPLLLPLSSPSPSLSFSFLFPCPLHPSPLRTAIQDAGQRIAAAMASAYVTFLAILQCFLGIDHFLGNSTDTHTHTLLCLSQHLALGFDR